MRGLFFLALWAAVNCYGQFGLGPAQTFATLPLSVPAPHPPVITQTVKVSEGENFQAALNAAATGMNIECSGLFIGNFYIPGVSGVEISGTCTLQSPNTSPALMNISATEGFGWKGNAADRAATNWWITGITIATSGPIYHAVSINNDCDADAAGMPSGITFSNVTVNGIHMADGQQNGMYLDGANISVIDSQVTQWQSSGTLLPEANAIEIICGTGPYLFRGNTLSASSEDFLIAAPGSSPNVPSSQITPSDITFTGNTLTKDLAWVGTKYAGDKNCWESKDSERVLISGNKIQNCYPGSQTGEGILLTPRIGLGNPVQHFSVVSDTTITGNTIQAGVGISVSGMDSYCTAAMDCVYSERTVISGNTMTVSKAPNGVAGSYGWCLQIDQPKALQVTGMTCTTDGQQSVFVDTYPCVQCSISSSAFNADFGGQGITGPAALFHSATGNANLGNRISEVTISGIPPTSFQHEWVQVCASCSLK
jgi:hypothetical protein